MSTLFGHKTKKLFRNDTTASNATPDSTADASTSIADITSTTLAPDSTADVSNSITDVTSTTLAPDSTADVSNSITDVTSTTLADNADSCYDFASLGLCSSLISSCRLLGFKKPTPVQRHVIPAILKGHHVLALSKTGSGKTACFVLPILQELSKDPYGIFAVVLSPTRELAMQIQEQIVALGSRGVQVRSVLVTGGMDQVQQSNSVLKRPHIIVATPGRLAYLLRGPSPPNLSRVRFVVLDEADRLLSPGGFERDVAEILLQTQQIRPNNRQKCQTLMFSATMTRSLEQVQKLASPGGSSLPLQLIRIDDDGRQKTDHICKNADSEQGNPSENPRIPSGLVQQYIFMPSRVREAYLITAIRNLVKNGGRQHSNKGDDDEESGEEEDENSDSDDYSGKARSVILFVSTCECAARLEALLHQLHIQCVALHGLLTHDRRMASLMKFKSHQVRMLVATDVASRGLDIPEVDLVINVELPRNADDYIHRVGRTARAGRRGLAVSLVGERDIALVHACERLAGRPMVKCEKVTDNEAVKLLSAVTKATRLANMKLMNIGFQEQVQKRLDRRAKDKREYRKAKEAAEKTVQKNDKKRKNESVDSVN